ncbi:hypothetical protein MHBO_002251 [Bonamia ostreae]|uniref:Uncharacterized protein n=1 Tax=Bonamia ostreae TaxID=126728 RepID=A0ABV2ALR5_9EUKA
MKSNGIVPFASHFPRPANPDAPDAPALREHLVVPAKAYVALVVQEVLVVSVESQECQDVVVPVGHED